MGGRQRGSEVWREGWKAMSEDCKAGFKSWVTEREGLEAEKEGS